MATDEAHSQYPDKRKKLRFRERERGLPAKDGEGVTRRRSILCREWSSREATKTLNGRRRQYENLWQSLRPRSIPCTTLEISPRVHHSDKEY